MQKNKQRKNNKTMNAKMMAVETLKINFKLITAMLVYRQTPNIIFLIFTCYYRQIKF